MNKAEALKILGITDKDPDDKTIKKAFKKKAVKLHPDVNKSDNAEEQFKELNAAQDFLLNPPAPPQEQFNPNDFGGFSGFSDFFGGPRVRFNVKPILTNTNISFKDSVLGCNKQVKINKKARCEECICKTCNGEGAIRVTIKQRFGVAITTKPCTKCKGMCKDDTCTTCSNSGIVQKTSEVSIKIPGGISNGQRMKLGGFGDVENYSGRFHYGDIILTVNVEHNKDMRIQNMDVISNIDVSLLEALEGTKKKVPTILGEKEILIKKNAKHSDVITLKRHGVNRRGSHVFKINVIYPKDTSKLIDALKAEEE
jgi:molecular chaperone DnaJ